MSTSTCCSLPEHIFILVHGNNGSPNDFVKVHDGLIRQFGTNAKIILSSGNYQETDRGIVAGGHRLFQEVLSVLQHTPGPKLHQLTFVGHSLGGLFCRYAIGLLVEYLEQTPSSCPVELTSYVSICTPHLGSRRPSGPSTWKASTAVVQ